MRFTSSFLVILFLVSRDLIESELPFEVGRGAAKKRELENYKRSENISDDCVEILLNIPLMLTQQNPFILE